MQQKEYSTWNKILILRFSRLGRLPPAVSATTLLKENGFPTLVFEFGNTFEEKRCFWDGLYKRRSPTPTAQYLPSKLKHFYILFTTCLKLFFIILKEGRPLLVVSHGLQENFICLFLNIIFNIPCTAHVHEILERKDLKGKFEVFLFLFEKYFLKKTRFLIFPDQKRIEIYQKKYQLTCPISFVPNTPRLFSLPKKMNLRLKYQLPLESVLMGYIGGIGPSNCFLEATRAVASFPTLHFLIWGWGEESYFAQIKKLATELKITERIHLLGILDTEKWETLSGCDFSYCIYSEETLRLRYETTASNKFFEAMACAIPSLASATFKNFKEVDQVAICTHSSSSESIFEGLRILVNDPIKRNQLGIQGRKLFEEKYYFEKFFIKTFPMWEASLKGLGGQKIAWEKSR